MRLSKVRKLFLKTSILILNLFFTFSASATPLFIQKAFEQKKETKDAKVLSMQEYVEKHPDDLKAKISLAEKYYQNAYFDLAVQELQDLKNRKLISDQGKLLLAKCYYMLGDLESLHTNIQIGSEKNISPVEQEILVVKADGLVFQEKYEEAKMQYRSLLQKNPILGSAWIGLARLFVRKYELDEAKNSLREARKLVSDEAEITLIESDIYRLSEDLESAKTLYEKVLQLKPNHVWARINYASLLLTIKQIDLFYQQMNWLSEHVPTHPQTQFFQGLKTLQAGNFKEGIATLESLLNKYPGHTATIRLLARAYYNQGDLQRAEALISPYVTMHPEDSEAVVLESVIALKMNNPHKVIRSLSPFVSNVTQNDRILSLLGTAYLLIGDMEKGLALLDIAEKNQKNKPEKRQESEAIEEVSNIDSTDTLLEGVVTKTGDNLLEEKVLEVKNYLSKKQYDVAYQLALSLIKQDPNNAVSRSLLGKAYQGLGDLSSASNQFKQALQLSPGTAEFRYDLAVLYVSQSEYDLADKEIQTILNQQTNYIPALLLKAQLLAQKGELEKAKKLLEHSYLLNRPEKETAIALLKLFKSHFASSVSYEFSKKIAAQFYQDTVVQNLAAQIAYDQGDFLGAKNLYSQALSLSPSDLEASQGLIQTYIAMGRMNQALSLINKLSERNANNKNIVLLYADLALKTQDSYQLNKALERIVNFPEKEADIFRKKGDILTALKQPQQALAAYEEGYQLSPDAKMAMFLYQLEESGDKKHALYRLQDWVANNPEDFDTQHYLAQQLMNTDQEKVIQIYQRILNNKPEDLVALNNIALLLSSKNPSRALSLIAKGYKKNKNNPKILDTYGWVLMKNKQREEALKYLKLAFEKDDKDLEIRWHYAYVLYHNGDVQQAKDVLGTMLNDSVLQSKLSDEAKKFLFEIS